MTTIEADRSSARPTVQGVAVNGPEVHPATTLLRESTPQEYEQIREDIRQNGLRVPVVVADDGRILDGRTRARACAELGIPYATRAATVDEMMDPVAFVLSMNAARRHLTGDQVIALYLEAHKTNIAAQEQAAKATQQANLKKGLVRPEGPSVSPSGKTADKIAKALGKSASAVKRVRRVKKVTPDRFAEVAQGAASAAEILKQEIPRTSEAARADKKEAINALPETKPIAAAPHVPFMDYRKTGKYLIESVIGRCQQEVVSEASLWCRMLADAKQIGHQNLDLWLQEMVNLHIGMGAVIERLKRDPCPSGEELEVLLWHALPQQQDEVAGSAASESVEEVAR